MDQELEARQEKARRTAKKMNIAIVILFVISASVAIFIYVNNLPPPAHKYDALARCIAQSSTTFYGAFWCPHCAEQKTKFGTGAQYLPYVECSTPDGQHSTPACIAAGIENYPTWQFKDGSRLVGVQSVTTLAQRTGCPLPTSTPS